MKNITLKVDDETYRKARIRAAEKGTSVSAMVREFLTGQANAENEQERRRIAALDELYKVADTRGKSANQSLTPLTREDIYADRVR
ncbi:MAG: hypothetical protein EOP88_22370 [Verrucomicrobiaceae bacterium]|nr:MAG: hypothetical protein EOP88_22370 [Verrucomicrobiaceae bacterium]